MNITPDQLDAHRLRQTLRDCAHALVNANVEYAKANGFRRLPPAYATREWKKRIVFEWQGTVVALQTCVIEEPTRIVVVDENWTDEETLAALASVERCTDAEPVGRCYNCGGGNLRFSQTLTTCSDCGNSWVRRT